jgi:hypothetical protein
MNASARSGALLLAMALMLGSGAAWAQADTPDARREAASALVKSMDKLMGPERIMGSMRAAMQAPMMQGIRANKRLTPAQQERAGQVMVDTMVEATTDMLREVMPGMYAAMTDTYATRFTLLEIRELQRFYASEVGQKSITVMQDDMPRMMQPMMQTIQAQAPRLQQRIEAAVQRLRDEGIELQEPQKKP